MGGNISTESDDESLNVRWNSSEYKFCDKFLGLQSNWFQNYQSEFRRRFRKSGDGQINWDFWTGHRSYESAYLKTIQEMRKLSQNDARELYGLAVDVVQQRTFQLNPKTGTTYQTHLNVVNNWKEIENNLLHRIQADPGISLGHVTLLGIVGAAAIVCLFVRYGPQLPSSY